MDVVYSAIYGGYDPCLYPTPTVPDVEFVAFTDDPGLTGIGWDVRVVSRPDTHPRMRAKWFKLHPHLTFPDADRTLWLDGSHRILSATAVTEALDCLNDGTVIVAHRHPGRTCIYAEAEASMQFRKYQGLPILEQAAAYRREGHPADWGLWACGSLARARSRDLDGAMNDWWRECETWSFQDQVSFPVILRRAGLIAACFPHPQYSSPWFDVLGHARDD